MPWLLLPVRPGGRDASGVDCWGLVYLYHPAVLGLVVPRLDAVALGSSPISARAVLREVARFGAAWIRLPAGGERPGDILVMRRHGRPLHVGIVVSTCPRMVLHADTGAGAVLCERYAVPGWRYPIDHALRHPARGETGRAA